MSRRIAVDLYNVFMKLRPDCVTAKEADIEAKNAMACVVKVMMTSSAA